MGRYELLFRIASGGMAEVFAARVRGEAGFQKLVALKRMLPTLADDEEFVSMFLDEARVAANISSPNCVQTLDLGRDKDGALFIVMELVVGVTLSRIVKEAKKARGAVPVGMAVELIAQAAEGLHAAHEAHTPDGQALEIVHRDVSPQNILVGVDGRARLTDFGVARAVLRMTKTDAGRIKGKFAYCSPEQLKFDAVDRRSDVFSLGVVAWEAFAGQRLFVADHPLAIMERVQSMPVPDLTQVRERVPKEVSDVVLWALSRNPDERPPTAYDFAENLRRAARKAGVDLPMQSEVGSFVKAAGGKALNKIRDNIRKALSSSASEFPDAPSAQQLETPSYASGILRSEVSSDMDTEIEVSVEESIGEVDASKVANGPGTLINTPTVVQQQPSLLKPMLMITTILMFAILAGVTAAFFLGSDSNEKVQPASTSPSGQQAKEPKQEAKVEPKPEPETPKPEATNTEQVNTEASIADMPSGVLPPTEVVKPKRPTMGRVKRPKPRTEPKGSEVVVEPWGKPKPTAMASPTPKPQPKAVKPEPKPEPKRVGPLLGEDAFNTGK